MAPFFPWEIHEIPLVDDHCWDKKEMLENQRLGIDADDFRRRLE